MIDPFQILAGMCLLTLLSTLAFVAIAEFIASRREPDEIERGLEQWLQTRGTRSPPRSDPRE